MRLRKERGGTEGIPALYHWSVRVLRGKVVSGKVIVEGEPLEDGSTVTAPL
jgi:hypothetical protein